jgi:peptide/nickel transport system permease protein
VGAVPIVLGIATLVFFVSDLAPGDPATVMIRPGMSEQVVRQIRTNFGLDQPVGARYVKWMGSLLHGDMGQSFTHGRPVRDVLMSAVPATLLLSGTALLLSFLLGIAAGVLQAMRQNGPVDSGLNVTLLFFYSMPSFWLALMLILVFSYAASNLWHWPFWFPASGMQSADYDLLSLGGRIQDRAVHLVLPVLSLTLVLTAGVARFVRSSMLEVVRQDYVRTARAKGLSERAVMLRHALRNALLPVVTLLGLHLPILFSGTVFIEEVFAWPGMGRLMVGAIHAQDYPLVMGGSILFALIVVAGNLVADILYAVVDPRVRYE